MGDVKFYGIKYWVLRWLIASVTIFGNGLVIALIATRPNLRTARNWFVLSLALADFMIGAYNCPKEFANWLTEESQNFDLLHPYFLRVSSTCLVAMATDRYVAVIYPFKYQSFMTRKKQLALIILSWLVPLFLAVPLVVGLGQHAAPYQCFLTLLLRGLPIVVLPVSLTRVLVVARRVRRQDQVLQMQVAFNHQVPSAADSHEAAAEERKRRASVKATAAVIVFFCLTNAIEVWDLININLKSGLAFSDHGDFANDAGLVLLNLNAAVNFVIYGFFQKEFRHELKASLSCCCCCCP